MNGRATSSRSSTDRRLASLSPQGRMAMSLSLARNTVLNSGRDGSGTKAQSTLLFASASSTAEYVSLKITVSMPGYFSPKPSSSSGSHCMATLEKVPIRTLPVSRPFSSPALPLTSSAAASSRRT